MRIITGKLKGRNVPIPKTDLLRPTSDRTKESLFSVIAARRYLDQTVVLDLFAGSGNLGFEAISRGAKHATFVDSESAHLEHITKLATTFEVDDQILTVQSDVEDYLERSHASFDFIFADPPYDYYNMEGLIHSIMDNDWLNTDGWFILEHDKRHDFSKLEKCVFSKAYGRTIVSIFKHSDLDS
ncbi:MAG: 16S rRNA (guanine(966)-N(2))-methyltransferase RsmD [Balneolaceae bacterium]